MLKWTLWWGVLVLFGMGLVSVLVPWGWFSPPTAMETLPTAVGHAGTPSPLVHCVVRTVYDGDTLGCDLNRNHRIDGQAEHVRLLGIDAPEMHYSRKNKTGQNEPRALEALRFVEHAALNRTVYLEFDEARYDKYHRTLAYVYLDPAGTVMLNRQLLSRRLARVLFLHPNRRYEGPFEALVQQGDKQPSR